MGSLNLQVKIPMAGYGIRSSASAAAKFNRTKTPLDTGDYDGATYFFEIDAFNAHATIAYFIRLIDSSDTVIATITIPALTGSLTSVKRLRTAAFTPNSGLDTYRVEIEQTAAGSNVGAYGVFIVIDQVDATKTRLPMFGNFRVGGTSSDAGSGFIESSAATSYNVIGNDGELPKDDAWFDGYSTLKWEMEVTARANAGNGDVRLMNDNGDVTVGELNFNSSTIAVKTLDITGSSVLIDGEFFHFQHKHSGGASIQTYKTAIYVTLTGGLSKARIFHLYAFAFNITTGTVHEFRELLESSKFEGPTIRHGFSGFESISGDIGMFVHDVDSNDGPGSGSGANVTGSKVEVHAVSGEAQWKESAGFTVDDGDRFILKGERTTGQATGMAFVIFDIEFQPDETLETLETPDQFTFGDSADFLASPVTVMEPDPIDLVMTDQGEFGPVQAFEDLEGGPDAISLGDSGEFGPTFKFELIETQPETILLEEKALGGPSPEVDGLISDFTIGSVFTTRALMIGEIRIDSGVLFRAGKGIRHPTRFYVGKISSFGNVIRSIPVPTGVPHIGDAFLTIIDTDGELRKLFASIPPQNREIVLKIGSEGESESLFATAYTGLVTHVTFPPGLARVTVKDKTFSFFEELLPDLLTRENFAPDVLFAKNLRGRTEGRFEEEQVFSPIVFGVVDSVGTDTFGAINAVRLDARTYNLTQHPIPHAAVRLFGKDSGDDEFFPISANGVLITEEIKTIDGIEYTFTHAIFGSDKPEGFEVRWDGEGMTDTGDKDGVVVRNPADCIKLYLTRIVRKDEFADLDVNGFAEQALVLSLIETGSSLFGFLCDGAITARMNHQEAIARLLTSFGIFMFTNKRGQITIKYVEDSIEEERVILDDVQDIYLKTETHSLAKPVFNEINLQFKRMFSTGEWNIKETVTDEDAVIAWSKKSTKDLKLFFVRDLGVAARVTRDFLTWVNPGSFRIVFKVPGHRRIPEIELAGLFGITNYSGLDETGGGYVNREFMVHKTEFLTDSKQLQIHAITRVSPVITQGAVAGIPANDARFGPFFLAPSSFFAVFRDRLNVNRLIVQASINSGVNWVEADAENAPDYPGEIAAYDAIPDRADPTTLLIVTQTVDNGSVDLHKFDMMTLTWTLVKRNVVPGDSGENFNNSRMMAQIDRSRLSGILGVFYMRDMDLNNPGAFGGDRLRTAWTHSPDEGVTWSAPVDIGQDVGATSKFGEKYEYHGGRIVAGKQDRFHFFYNREPGDRVRSTPDEYHRTALNDQSLSTEVKWGSGNLLHFAAPYPYGVPGTNEDPDGDVEIRLPIKSGLGGYHYSVTSKDQLNSLIVWKRITDRIVFQGQTANITGPHYPAFVIQRDPIISTLWHYIVSTAQSGSWTWHKSGTPDPGFDPVGVFDQQDRVGPFYNEPFNPQHMGALILNLAGENWIATLQSVGIQEVTSGGFIYNSYFTLWPLSILPRPESFDTTQIEALISETT